VYERRNRVSDEKEIHERLQALVGRTLERIEFAPFGVLFHFSGGLVYLATGGPPRHVFVSPADTTEAG
jgi:hypothetical protein